MQRWKCCSSWSKQNPKHFSNTGFPQGKPVFFSAYIFLAPEWPGEGKGRVIGQKELVKNPATLVESSVAGFLSSLKQDEGWTKRVGEKCFKPLIYKAFLCLHLP